VTVRGFTADAERAAAALRTKISAQWQERELLIHDAEVASETLLNDLKAAVAGQGATVALAPGGRAVVVVRALGAASLDAAMVACYQIKEAAKKTARAPPVNWDWEGGAADGSPAPFVLTAVDKDSAEWVRVAGMIAKTMPAATVTRLERVQNPKLWAAYAQRRSEVAADSDSGFDANEIFCFHGTRKFPVGSACQNGLDFRHGNTSSMWGVALYVAVNASYSDVYSSDGPDGTSRQFFVARAALGRTKDLKADSSIRQPPPGFESVQGVTNGSRVHMLYDLGQAYPEYLVTYRRE
jgi:hypothetical protein